MKDAFKALVLLLLVNTTAFSQIENVIEQPVTEIWNQSDFVFDRPENYLLKNYKPIPETLPCKWWGYWDSNYTPEDVPANIFRCYLNDNCNEGIERGNRLAILLNDFRPEDSEALIRKRLQNWNNRMTHEVREATEFIILEDEPRHKGFSVKQLERMVEIAREEIGDYKFTFSFMRRASWENILPENLDVVWINFYPFYRQDYYPELFINTQENFNRLLSTTLARVRKKIPHAKIMLTGQAFYDEHYREPPLKSVQWYHEFIQNHEYILGILWYQWRDFKGIGTTSMPKLYNIQTSTFESMCANESALN